MLKINWRFVFVCGLVALCLSIIACDNKALDALKSELNKTNFNSVNPANDWTYAGGIVVYDAQNPKGGAAFYGLPAGVDKPQTVPANAVWGAQEIDRTFTAQALINGIGSVLKTPISGGVAVNYSLKTTLAQITATGTRAPHPDSVLTNEIVAGQIKDWLNTGHLRVYIVNTALDTTNLSAKTTDNGGVAAVFGGSIKDCAPPTAGSSSGGSSGGSSSGGNSSSGGGATNGSGKGTVSFQGCKTNNDSFTLTTTTPLVFATLTNAVTLKGDGTLFYNPTPQVPPGGFQRKRRATQAPILSDVEWKKVSWPAK